MASAGESQAPGDPRFLFGVMRRLCRIPLEADSLPRAAQALVNAVVADLPSVGACSLLIYHPEDDCLRLLAVKEGPDCPSDPGPSARLDRGFRLGEGVAGKVFLKGQAAFLYRDMLGIQPESGGFPCRMPPALACLPIAPLGRPLGVLNICLRQPQAMEPRQQDDFLMLGHAAANILQLFLYKEVIDQRAERQVELALQREREIEARLAAQKALTASERMFNAMLEASPDPMIVYDTRRQVVYLNPSFTRVFGWRLGDIQPHAHNFILTATPGETAAAFGATNSPLVLSGVENALRNSAGGKVEVSMSQAAYKDLAGRIQGYVVTLQDITRRKQAERHLKFIAFHDTLTGLPNRAYFYKQLKETVELAQRGAINHSWAVMFMDLDRFKDINDTLGHDVGDEVLKMVAERIKACLRATDRVFRLGGDEFTIILQKITHDIDAAKVAQKMQESLHNPVRVRGRDLFLSASIGISVYPNDGDDVLSLVRHADIAMYAAKRVGKSYQFFTKDLNRRARERMALESRLRAALGEKRMEVHYQPLVDGQGRVAGMEALLRWNDSELGEVSPSQFIPLAEELGVILPLGEWVLRRSCRRVVAMGRLVPWELFITVNLSPRQFKQTDLVNVVDRAVRDAGIAPHALKLEITEGCLMDNPEEAIERMRRLRELGVRISVDDFGTGYSSLNYLKRFPINSLKIDRAFVKDLPDCREDQAIVRTIISLARDLGLKTVAEGVESREQAEFLVEHGCDYLQGYLFGRAMSGGDMESLLLQGVQGRPRPF